jgi:TrpR-related protein YerC/YecD
MKIDRMKIENVFAKINDEFVILNLLRDILTPQEFKAIQERLDIAILLNDGLSYSEIAKQTGASTTTVTRVSRFLKHENHGGYRWVFENIENFK